MASLVPFPADRQGHTPLQRGTFVQADADGQISRS
jgi:hypothetical protein